MSHPSISNENHLNQTSSTSSTYSNDLKHHLLTPAIQTMVIGEKITQEILQRDYALEIEKNVSNALQEDIQAGDITAELLEPNIVQAYILTREDMCMCGQDWANEVVKQLNKTSLALTKSTMKIEWLIPEGEWVKANEKICHITGDVRLILTAERTILNFIQTLSAVATKVYLLTRLFEHSKTKLLDTRKTIPQLRLAQKYAVACGGGFNHRLGLYHAFLIKENHIAAAGSIAKVIHKARALKPNANIEIEVETLDQLTQALDAQADIIMLDNFDQAKIIEAVTINQNHAKPALLEVSGNINEQRLKEMIHIGVDFISAGTLTKDVKAIDLSLRLNP
jgi:nicotinate-nucleotide pyrophosphorylase (carboxylating)